MTMFMRFCRQSVNIDGNLQLWRVFQRLACLFRPFSRQSSGGISRLVILFVEQILLQSPYTTSKCNTVFLYHLDATMLSCKPCKVLKILEAHFQFLMILYT